MTNWQIRVGDPSGESRVFPIHGTFIVGRDESCLVPLRDATAPREALSFWPAPASGQSSPYWMRATDAPVLLGDIPVREAQVPAGLRIRVGESMLTLEALGREESMPVQPSGIRHWKTVTEAGAKVLWTAK